ncbi:ABC transporter permease [Flavobacterium sp. CBA20B-1]|uniref:ABC transporter permease n=1 Tax=unclassified Flavobacterium TaxID=196869 RepID=UPI002225047C|nr:MULTISPECIES: ABC transporter permease [unclassified Flavobacterium]WCM43127.1 ABC transporter permease [Flavobacterium sp. CBA20B-1]
MFKKFVAANKKALQKFKRNSWGVFSLAFIVILTFIALFAYVIAPDNTINANNGDVSISTQKPGFTVQIINIPLQKTAKTSVFDFFTGKAIKEQFIPILSYQFKGDTLYYNEFSIDPATSQTKYILTNHFPTTNHQLIEENHIQTKKYWLGTDNQGRDYLSRLLVGARVSLAIGFVAVFISLIIGISLGAVAGYFGGKNDAFILWLINVIWSIPTLLLVIAITLALGKGFWQVFIAVGLTMWVEVARVVRGQVMSVKQMQYVTAARALGFSDMRIIFKHIIPNIMAPVIVISAANFASAILVESGLSFLGLGAQVPVPSWGGMIKEHYNYIILGKPHLALIPGLAMCMVVVAFMMIGNALRDALDVKG